MVPIEMITERDFELSPLYTLEGVMVGQTWGSVRQSSDINTIYLDSSQLDSLSQPSRVQVALLSYGES